MVDEKVLEGAGLGLRLPVLLAEAHASRQLITFAPGEDLTLSREEGFAIQAQLAQGLGTIVGWKVGRKNPTALPIYAPLLHNMLYASGAEIGRDVFHTWNVEAEIIFRLNQDLPRRDQPYTPGDIARSVGTIITGFEIIDSRYAAWPDLPPPVLLADLQSHGAMVLGTETPFADHVDFSTLPVTLRIDGEITVQHQNGNPVGDILELTAWLANTLADKGPGLRKDDLITTGSYTGMTHLAPGQKAVAAFDGFGHVEVSRGA